MSDNLLPSMIPFFGCTIERTVLANGKVENNQRAFPGEVFMSRPKPLKCEVKQFRESIGCADPGPRYLCSK